MLLKYYKFLLLGLFLLVSGCIHIFPCKSRFSIKELPEAVINQPYLQKIEIYGGGMPDEGNINWEITPESSGLTITRLTYDDGSYKGIEISGVPTIQGDISIDLFGFGYWSPNCVFDKTFILKVNPPNKQDTKD